MLQARMWINQPSTLQDWHKYHGRLVITGNQEETKKGIFVEVFFVGGAKIGTWVHISALSNGWPKHLLDKQPPLTHEER